LQEAFSAKGWSLPASLVLHTLLLVALMPPLLRREAPSLFEEPVQVEIWTAEELTEFAGRAALPGRNETPPAPLPENATPEPGPPAPSPVPGQPPSEPAQVIPPIIRATRILSGDVLAHPASRKMRQMLPLLEEETRLEQLCNLEAMAQIAAALKQFEPDRVVAYAMADTKRAGNVIVAEGAAFRSGSQWYGLKYRCRLGADRKGVQAFELSVGDAIPRRVWEVHNLPAPEADTD